MKRASSLLWHVFQVLCVLVLAILWPWAPSLAQGPPGGVDARTYTVQPGDTLYRLSLRFGTTVDDLVALNDIRDPDLIYVGQVLRVSAAAAPAAPPAGGPLTLTWERIRWRHEGQNYISELRITAQGGQPPYTYYHDGLVQAGNTFEVAWRRGVAKPGSVGVADATGTYVKQDYWLQDACAYYPAGVEIIKPSEGAKLKTFPRNFNITWRHTIDPPPDAYWIEIEVRRDDGWQPWQLYDHKRGKSELFFVPDVFPGDLGGRLRMWGVYGSCEAREKTPWRYFEFRVTY